MLLLVLLALLDFFKSVPVTAVTIAVCQELALLVELSLSRAS